MQQPGEFRETFLKVQKRIRPKDKGSYSAKVLRNCWPSLPAMSVLGCCSLRAPSTRVSGAGLSTKLCSTLNQTRQFINFMAYKKKNPNFPWLYFGLGNELLESKGSTEIILDSAVTEKLHVELHYCTQKLTRTAKDPHWETSGQLEAKLSKVPLGIHGCFQVIKYLYKKSAFFW